MKNKHVEKSLKHWFRMRRWVRKQPKYNNINCWKMLEEISESPDGKFCALCKNYFKKRSCDCCPLYKFTRLSCGKDTLSPWMKANDAQDWGEWLKNSNEMIKDLWEIRNYE
jgi:hypothetical protein